MEETKETKEIKEQIRLNGFFETPEKYFVEGNFYNGDEIKYGIYWFWKAKLTENSDSDSPIFDMEGQILGEVEVKPCDFSWLIEGEDGRYYTLDMEDMQPL